MSATVPIDIRPVRREEIPLLRDFAEQTFLTAFGPRNTVEDMAIYVEHNFSLSHIQQEFEQPDSQFFMAWQGATLVGYLKINSGNSQTEQCLENALEIERIYVSAAHQGQRIGQALLAYAVMIAQEANKSWVWLGVWDQNHGAIQFYQRHGFITFDQHEFYLGKDKQTDLMMKRKL